MATSFRQDMPPEGGYGSIEVARKIPKRYLSNKSLLLGFLGVTVWGYFDLKSSMRRAHMRREESYNSFVALEPFLQAERDRLYLRQLIINNREEDELMKNVPNWKTGTLFGEPFYQTTPKDSMPFYGISHFYRHRPSNEAYNHMFPEMNM